METQAKLIQDDCELQQKVSQDVSRNYQTKLTTLNSQLSRYKRMLNDSNGLPASNPTGGYNGAEGTEYAGESGGNAWLDYGRDAESIRLQLNSCQDFINQVWQLRKD